MRLVALLRLRTVSAIDASENPLINVQFSDKDGDGVREVQRITVILSGGDVFRDPDQIKRTVFETFGCECECAID